MYKLNIYIYISVDSFPLLCFSFSSLFPLNHPRLVERLTSFTCVRHLQLQHLISGFTPWMRDPAPTQTPTPESVPQTCKKPHQNLLLDGNWCILVFHSSSAIYCYHYHHHHHRHHQSSLLSPFPHRRLVLTRCESPPVATIGVHP
jgi:hypothetical protein